MDFPNLAAHGSPGANPGSWAAGPNGLRERREPQTRWASRSLSRGHRWPFRPRQPPALGAISRLIATVPRTAPRVAPQALLSSSIDGGIRFHRVRLFPCETPILSADAHPLFNPQQFGDVSVFAVARGARCVEGGAIRAFRSEIHGFRGPDRCERSADRSKRSADRREPGADRSKRTADRRERGADRSKRTADRCDRGPDRPDRAAEHSFHAMKGRIGATFVSIGTAFVSIGTAFVSIGTAFRPTRGVITSIDVAIAPIGATLPSIGAVFVPC